MRNGTPLGPDDEYDLRAVLDHVLDLEILVWIGALVAVAAVAGAVVAPIVWVSAGCAVTGLLVTVGTVRLVRLVTAARHRLAVLSARRARADIDRVPR